VTVATLACAVVLLPLSQLTLSACMPYTTRTFELESGATVVHLVLGRAVRQDVYDGRGVEVSRFMASYDEPLPCMTVTECGSIVQSEMHDDDADGRWDRWQRRVRRGERCFVEYRVDTDHDGASDWTFQARGDDYDETMASIRSRRGY
jgi:hypothetical protein